MSKNVMIYGIIEEMWVTQDKDNFMSRHNEKIIEYVERKKLTLVILNANILGKPIVKPVPLYLGLLGHSYPPKSEMTSVEFENFGKYLMEK